MSITITDPALLAELIQARGIVELKNPLGELIGALSLEDRGRLPPGMESPFTDAEMAERRKVSTGRPLADILRDLEARS